MLLERDNEKKNRGKATQLLQLPPDICGKLKDLDLRDSETSEGKLKVTDNFSKMKDSKENNFGDDINKIGDQFKNIKIVDEELNFPPKKAEIVLNILCDNNIQDNKNCKVDRNINFDEDQLHCNENKIPEADVLKGEKVNRNLKSDTSALIPSKLEKYETAEKVCNVSSDSKKTEEDLGGFTLFARAPVSQKICQQEYQPYDIRSRSHNSGGIVRLAEQPTRPTHPPQSAVNGYQQWSDISQLNIIPNGQEQYAPHVQTPFLHVNEGQTTNNITSEYTEQGISSEPELDDDIVQWLLQESPYIGEFCDMVIRSNTYDCTGAMAGGDINQNNKVDEIVPGSPGDSGTSSLGSPAGSFCPPQSVGDDSVLDSPSHGADYPGETLYDDRTEYKPQYCPHWDSDTRKMFVAQEWREERPDTQGGEILQKRSDMQNGLMMQQRSFPQDIQQRPFPQGVQQGPYPQGIQQRPFPQGVQQRPFPQSIQQRSFSHSGDLLQENRFLQGRDFIQEKQNKQILQETSGPQIIQEKTNLQGQQIVHEKTQGKQIIKEKAQGKQIIHERTQGKQIIHERTQGKQIIHERTQGKQIIHERTQGNQIILEKTQDKQIIQEMTQGKQIIRERMQGKQFIEKRSDVQNGQIVQDTPYSQGRDNVPRSCVSGESSNKIQGTKYRIILPKPEQLPKPPISPAKTRFQQILDKDRRFAAWLKINQEVIANPKQLETQDAEGDTDLMIECCNKSESHLEYIYAMVEKMRKENPNSLNIRNKQGHTALYLACRVLNDVPEVAAYIAEALVEQKVDFLNMTYDGGLSLIQILEKKGETHKKVLDGLLALKDSSGRNVFQPGNDVNANNYREFNESILLL